MLREKFILPMAVNPSFLGLENILHSIPGKIIAIESYKDCTPTFSWLSDSGHLFCYLPAHAFGFYRDLKFVVDFNCPSMNLNICSFNFKGPGFGIINGQQVAWDKYLISVDWAEANMLAHLMMGQDGLLWIRNSKFQVGGKGFVNPGWKKSRDEWKIK